MYESSILSSRGYCRKVLTKIRRGYFAEMLFPTWGAHEQVHVVPEHHGSLDGVARGRLDSHVVVFGHDERGQFRMTCSQHAAGS